MCGMFAYINYVCTYVCLARARRINKRKKNIKKNFFCLLKYFNVPLLIARNIFSKLYALHIYKKSTIYIQFIRLHK